MNFDFGNFIANNWQDLLQFLLLFIIAVIQFLKYGKVSKEVKENMKIRLSNYRENVSDEDRGGQSFDRVVPEYAYDENSRELYVVGSKDLQEIIQSSVDCALDRILDKFGALPPEMQPVPVQSDDVNIVDVRDDLSVANDMFDEFEAIREKYKFGDDVSYQEMFTKLKQMQADYDTQLKESIAKKNSEVSKNDEKKENK